MFFKRKYSIQNISKFIIGNGKEIPLINGQMIKSINFDNAASTPILRPVADYVEEFYPWYSSVHRGTGFKSQLSTEVYDFCHERVAEFFNADINKNTIIFTKNSSEAINKLSYRLNLQKDDVVLTSIMEHHSNDLPWRNKCHVEHIKADPVGSLDLNHLASLIKRFGRKVKLITITGASNVTGHINPIDDIAQMAHHAGIPILVDAAQLAPHRAIDMKPNDHPCHIDYIVCSAHKMYAPLGTGVLIGPKITFERGIPEYCGGGTIKSVTQDEIHWASPPDKDEAGSPNIIGAVALKKSMDILEEIGMNNISQHECQLMKHLVTSLQSHPNIILYGDNQSIHPQERVGVLCFNIKDLNHALVAAILSFEYGISVRNGCFCAHPYIHHLLDLSPQEIRIQQRQILQSNFHNVVGMVRVSFGMYNQMKEVNYFLNAIEEILEQLGNNYYQKKYLLDRKSGAYYPRDYEVNFQEFFPFFS